MNGKVESMKAKTEVGRSDTDDPFELEVVIDCKPTTRSRETSSSRKNSTSLETYLEES